MEATAEIIQYTGEHLLPGAIGRFLIFLAFTCALLSSISYLMASFNKSLDSNNWFKLARVAFGIHAISFVTVICIVFYLLLNHYFEYHYVWSHSSTDMPDIYMLSCFWEGQEGSFMLWTFWHIVLGAILVFTDRKWESSVMLIVCSVQVFLTSMLLGVYLGDYKIGSSPFVLLREHPEFMNLPFVKNPEYLSAIEGRGLNPLLRNYWMLIHPPTLFLGFSLTLMPFAYVLAALIKKEYYDWVKPALTWTFIGVAILGLGVLMGGAWAYEALSFGGFWAWDPVENSSLVPWLVLCAAGHLMLIYKNRKQSLLITIIFTCLAFILVLYSSFLTRSGVLGDASVHSFTDMGMSGQLLIYLLFYILLSTILLLINLKSFPSEPKEEHLLSREFWIFIGALVLFISAFQMIFSTSIPVINKVLGTNMAPPIDAIGYYNSWQLPFAVVISLLSGIGQYFKYKNTSFHYLLKKLVPFLSISIAVTLLVVFTLELYEPLYILLLFTSLIAVCGNLSYFQSMLKGNLFKAGASIAHVGVGLILLGALISMSKSSIISKNTSSVDVRNLGGDFNNSENILLRKGDTLNMEEYYVCYTKKEKIDENVYYEVAYMRKNEEGLIVPDFTLKPFVQLNPRMGNVAEPATRHFLTKDIYTHITYAIIDNEVTQNFTDTLFHLSVNDTVIVQNHLMVLDDIFYINSDNENQIISVTAVLKFINASKESFELRPEFLLSGNMVKSQAVANSDLGIEVSFINIHPEKEQFSFNLKYNKEGENKKDFIVMQAKIFPFINILWIGCIIMFIGTLLAVYSRAKRSLI